MNRYLTIPLLLSVFAFSFVAFKFATKAEAQNKTAEKTQETDADKKVDLLDRESAAEYVKERFTLQNSGRNLGRALVIRSELQAVQFDSIKQSELLVADSKSEPQSVPLLGSITVAKRKVTHTFPIFVDRSTRKIYVQTELGWGLMPNWSTHRSFDFRAKKADETNAKQQSNK